MFFDLKRAWLLLKLTSISPFSSSKIFITSWALLCGIRIETWSAVEIKVRHSDNLKESVAAKVSGVLFFEKIKTLANSGLSWEEEEAEMV